VFQAGLDDVNRQRPLPNLCVVCHGGKSADAAKDINDPSKGKKPAYIARSDVINENSKFLPFDLHFYSFPLANSKAAQEDSFRNLNIEIVKQVATAINPADPIAELITAWYPGNAGNQKDDAVIAGWNTGGAGNPNHQDNRMYRDVFSRACRTCHVAQPYSAPSFTTVADFKNQIGTVQTRVCVNKVMPHAQRTNEIFWSSLNPSMPGFLEIFGQSVPGWLTDINSQCGLFNQPADGTPKSFFEGTVYPILTANCSTSGCHNSGSPNANWHVLSVANTYNELLNAATIRPGFTHYIQPNDQASSLLYQKIEGNAGARMPLGGADLRSADTNVNGTPDATDVLNWITLFHAVGP
jgi:cytochrome c5